MIICTARDQLRGRTALVTGASSGMGVDYARKLARRGVNLILVARRAEALERVAKELRECDGIEVRVTPADLADGFVRTSVPRTRGRGQARRPPAKQCRVRPVRHIPSIQLGAREPNVTGRHGRAQPFDSTIRAGDGHTRLGPDSACSFPDRFPAFAALCFVWVGQKLRPFLGSGTQSRTTGYRRELHGGVSRSHCD
jgi:short chain dehydrogenase